MFYKNLLKVFMSSLFFSGLLNAGSFYRDQPFDAPYLIPVIVCQSDLQKHLNDNLVQAVYDNNKNLAEYWISRGAQAHIYDSKGRTLLHVAVHKKNIPLLELLLAHNANLDAQDLYGNAPLLLAIFRGQTPVIRYLIQKGARLCIPNKRGETAFSHLLANPILWEKIHCKSALGQLF